MNRPLLICAAILALTAPPAIAAGTDHVGHGMNYGNYTPGKAAYMEVINGVKATFNITPLSTMAEGGTETHHVSVAFNDMNTGKALASGAVTVKILAPDKSEQVKDLPALHGHFSADFALVKQGKYGVMCTFTLADGTVRSATFWYEIK